VVYCTVRAADAAGKEKKFVLLKTVLYGAAPEVVLYYAFLTMGMVAGPMFERQYQRKYQQSAKMETFYEERKRRSKR
jgi:hypothetical protein